MHLRVVGACKEITMKKILTLFLLMNILSAACATQPAAPMEPDVPVATQPANTVPSTALEESPAYNTYTNSQFGLSFQYPTNWFGPDEYISDSILRLAVGSDIVYPYGETPEQPSTLVNSYLVVLQYSQNDQNQYWKDTYQTVTSLQDGESFSDGRGLIIRVRQFDLGRFTGFEYIATLSENAQTEPSYSREVILVDEQSNLITISGRPNNVEVPPGSDWRTVYQAIDDANAVFFHDIVESITVQ
jgi:hypothetical protein